MECQVYQEYQDYEDCLKVLQKLYEQDLEKGEDGSKKKKKAKIVQPKEDESVLRVLEDLNQALERKKELCDGVKDDLRNKYTTIHGQNEEKDKKIELLEAEKKELEAKLARLTRYETVCKTLERAQALEKTLRAEVEITLIMALGIKSRQKLETLVKSYNEHIKALNDQNLNAANSVLNELKEGKQTLGLLKENAQILGILPKFDAMDRFVGHRNIVIHHDLYSAESESIVQFENWKDIVTFIQDNASQLWEVLNGNLKQYE